MGPEGDAVEEAIPVALGDVEDRVEAEVDAILTGDEFDVPEDWGQPEAKIEQDLGDRRDVADEDADRRQQPAEAEEEEEQGQGIVGNLQPEEGGRNTAQPDDRHDNEEEDEVEEEGGADLDDGENGDAELHLLDQEGVVADDVGTGADGIGEEIVGGHPGEEVSDKGDIAARLDFEAEAENPPHDQHHRQRFEEGPEQAEKGTGIAVLEVPAGEVVDLGPFIVDLLDKMRSFAEQTHGDDLGWKMNKALGLDSR